MGLLMADVSADYWGLLAYANVGDRGLLTRKISGTLCMAPFFWVYG